MTRQPPASVFAWLREGAARHKAGDLHGAERLYDKVLKVDSRNPDALNLKGLIVCDTGRPQYSLSYFDRAIEALPGFAVAYFNKGLALAALGRNAEALAAYAEAIRLKPDYADALLNYGLLLHATAHAQNAIATFRELTRISPKDARAYYNLGACLEKSLASTPADRRDEVARDSEEAFQRALALDPNNPDVHFAYSNLHTFRGAYRKAAEHLERALRARPQWPDAWNNLANQAEALGDREGALKLFDRALQQDAANAGAFVNRGLTLLALGQLAEGWKGYARRFDDPRFPFVPRAWPWPKWQGEPLDGKSILLWGDQGVGDELLYGSMIHEIAARAERCVVECEPRLVELYRRSFPGLEIVSARSAADMSRLGARSFDLHCSVLDIGAYLRPQFSAFPNRPGFLRADTASTGRLREKYLAAFPQNRLIGLSWRSVNPGIGHQKALDLKELLPLLAMEGATFLSLQYGDVRKDLGALKESFGIEIQSDQEINPLTDLDAFAAQVAACEYVVTISNTAAHFAGALGVPTALYVPNGRKRHWYWFDQGAYSPWYQSTRVFREPGAKGIEAILAALAPCL